MSKTTTLAKPILGGKTKSAAALPAGFSPCAIFLALTTCAEVPGCRQETTPSPWQGLCMAG